MGTTRFPLSVTLNDARKDRLKIVIVGFQGCCEDWLVILVAAPTGVAYRHQTGGVACDHPVLEGYMVPAWGSHPDLLHESCAAALRAVFHPKNACDYGHVGYNLPKDRLDHLRKLVENIEYHDEDFEPKRGVIVDDTRLDQIREAWVPVLLSSGERGFLAWENCD